MKTLPLLPLQRSMMYDATVLAGEHLNTVPVTIRWQGLLDSKQFERAINCAVKRHEALHVRIESVRGDWFQSFLGNTTFLKVSWLGRYEDTALIANRITKFGEEPIDPGCPPLMRCGVIQTDKEDWTIILVVHHAIADRTSIELFTREILHFYEAEATGYKTNLAPPGSYSEAIVTLLSRYETSHVNSRQITSSFSSNELRPLQLCIGKSNKVRHGKMGRVERRFSKDFRSQIYNCARMLRCTPQCLVMGAYAAGLFRLGTVDNLLIGVPVTLRDESTTENTFGPFVETLPILFRFRACSTISGIAQQAQNQIIDAFVHRYIDLSNLAREVSKPSENMTNPLFQTVFAWSEATSPIFFSQGVVEIRPPEPYPSRFDLSLLAHDLPDGFWLGLDSSLDVFDKTSASIVLDVTVTMLETLIRSPNLAVSNVKHAINYLMEVTEESALENNRGLSIWSRIQKHAQYNPHITAIVQGSQKVSYSNLVSEIIALANQLVEVEGPVAVLVPRSITMVECFLAVFAANRPLLLLDEEDGQTRILQALDLAGANTILTVSKFVEQIPSDCINIIVVDHPLDSTRVLTVPIQSPCYEDEERIAYIVLTSGTTGQPKLVAVSEYTLLYHLSWAISTFELHAKDRMLQFCSTAFDAVLEELLPPLVVGATVVLRDEESVASVEAFIKLLTQHRISIIDLPTGFFNALIPELAAIKQGFPSSLRLIVIGGEAYTKEAFEAWAIVQMKSPGKPRLLNTYGPSESTIVVTAEILETSIVWDQNCSTLGKPRSGVKLYLLDRFLQPVPNGMVGEIWIGGEHLAQGYLSDSRSTADKFRPDPFCSKAGARMFRTGDLARSTIEGNLIFEGRIDQQVKIQGVRVNPAEVESAIRTFPRVKDCIVMPHQLGVETRLGALVTSESRIETLKLKSYIRKKLSLRFCPDKIVCVESLPQTIRGKIDRSAVAQLLNTSSCPNLLLLDSNVSTVIGIIASLLGQTDIGPDDDFFEIGGHSLMTLRLISYLSRYFERSISVRNIFEARTPRRIAALINNLPKKTVQKSKGGKAELKERPLNPFATGLLFEERLLKEPSPYLIKAEFKIKGSFDPKQMQVAVYRLISSERQLISIVKQTSDGPLWIDRDPSVAIQSAFLIREKQSLLSTATTTSENLKICLDGGIPFQVIVTHYEDNLWHLSVNVHHAVADAQGIFILLNRLSLAYQNKGELNTSFQTLDTKTDWPTDESLLYYWREALRGVQLSLDLPTEHPRQERITSAANIARVKISQGFNTINRLASELETTRFVAALTIAIGWLHRITAQDDLVVGVPVSTREDPFENTISSSIVTLPIRSQINRQKTLKDLASDLSELLVTALDKRFIAPIELARVLRAVGVEWKGSLLPVIFDLDEGVFDFIPEFGLASVQPCDPDDIGVRADIEISLKVMEEDLALELRGRRDLFAPETLAVWARSLAYVFNQVKINNTKFKLEQITLVHPLSQDASVLVGPTSDINVNFIADFFRHASQSPSAIAVITETRMITFGDLKALVETVAQEISQFCKAGDSVALALPRSIEYITGLLAIWKIGAVPVLIDTRHSPSRIALMCSVSSPVAVLAGELTMDYQKAFSTLPIINIRTYISDKRIKHDNVHLFNQEKSLNNPAYIAFTSGSTGIPKAVVISHLGLANIIAWSRDNIPLRSDDVFLHVAAPGFDIALWEILHPITSGTTLIVADEQKNGDVGYLIELVERQHITIAHFVPTVLGPFLDALNKNEGKSLRILVCGGETVPIRLYKQLYSRPGIEMRHTYGPTETTIFVMHWRGNKSLPITNRLPLGTPISNTIIAVVDQTDRTVPKGVCGELIIGGQSLAMGYLGDPVETALKFIPAEFDTRVESYRFYRTGDVVRIHPNDSVEYYGRIDRQVKIGGIRVELTEIEAILASTPGVARALVDMRNLVQGNTSIVAYLLPDGKSYSSQELIDAARLLTRSQLGAAATPTSFVVIDALPMTPNGKVDRSALPDPISLMPPVKDEPVSSPFLELENVLLAIWQNVLGTQSIGLDDNFFDVGGDSISAIQIVSKARIAGIKLNISQVLRAGSIINLVRQLSRSDKHRLTSLLSEDSPIVLPPSIFRWLVLADQDDLRWVQVSIHQTSEALDSELVRETIIQLTQRHQVLGMSLQHEGGAWIVDVPNISSIKENINNVAVIKQRVNEKWEQTIDRAVTTARNKVRLSTGPLIGVACLLGSHPAIVFAIHHLAVDWYSWQILLDEFDLIYKALKNNLNIVLPEVNWSFTKWAKEASCVFKKINNVASWRDVLESTREIILPLSSASNRIVTSTNSPNLSILLRNKAIQLSVSVEKLALVATVRAIAMILNLRSFAIEIETSGREELDADLGNTVGWLTGFYPLPLEWIGSSIEDWFKSVEEGFSVLPSPRETYGWLRWSIEQPLQIDAPFLFNCISTEMSESTRQILLDRISSDDYFDVPAFHAVAVEILVNRDDVIVSVECRPEIFDQTTAEHLAEAITQGLTEACAVGNNSDSITETLNIENSRSFPLTPLQKGILLECLRRPSSGLYHTQILFKIEGAIDEKALQSAWLKVAQIHDAFRTKFVWKNYKDIVQVVEPDAHLDWRERNFLDKQNDWRSIVLAEDRFEPFDLGTVPLSRVTLIRLGTKRWLLWSHNHILFDGWSLPLVSKTLAQCYEAAINGIELHNHAPSYEAFVRWWQTQTSSSSISQWTDLLASLPKPVLLSGGSSKVNSNSYGSIYLELDLETSHHLRVLARQCRTTLHSVMLAAWSILLARRLSLYEIVFGIVISLRPGEVDQIDQLVGLCMNTVPFHVCINPSDSLEDLLEQVHQTLLDTIDHATVSLSAILQKLRHKCEIIPPFDTLIVFENYPGDRTGVVLEPSGRLVALDAIETSEFPWVLVVLPDEKLKFEIIYADVDSMKLSAKEVRNTLANVLSSFANSTKDMGRG